jgi:hypothetical protein
VTEVSVPVRWDASAPTQFRLDPGYPDARSVIEQLNRPNSQVTARIEGD